jgi:leucyl-tRNA synthetase
MGGFACSSWYFLRFASPHESSAPFNTSAVEYWLPVDLYVGGAEHAVLHLLYARFWTKFLADEGLIHFREPFLHLRNQGQLLAADGQRMSKSRGNVITPDSVVATYGADALRLYVMFIAPFDQDVSWNTDGINGARRFLNRVWTLFADTYFASADCSALDAGLERSLHRTIRAVTERIADFRLNTMISALMEFTNQLYDQYQAGNWQTVTYHQALDDMLLLLAPAAPYIAEELWLLTGKPGSVHLHFWPVWNEEKASEDMVELPVQVNGKFRLTIQVAREMSQEQVTARALEQPKLAELLSGCQIEQVFYVPGKIINIVCG